MRRTAPLGLAALPLLLAACATPAGVDGDDAGAFVDDAGARAPDDAGSATAVDAGSTHAIDDAGSLGARDDAGSRGAVADAGRSPEHDAGSTALEDAGTTDPVGYGAYDVDGPDLVTTVDLAVTTDGGHHFTEHVFLPSSPGPHPVVSLSPGLEQPAVAYTTHGTRLASHGIVVLTRDDPGLTVPTPIEITDLVYAIDVWLPQQNADPVSPLFGVADLTRIALAGHSRGGKATLLAAEHELHGQVLGWFGLDIVDNIALSGNEFAITDEATVGIPVVFLGAQIASSCTPANTTADTLYPAAVSPAVKIIGIGAGHTELEDQAGCNICSFCTPSGTADPAVVLRYTVRYLAAFMGRVLNGDTTVGDAFEGAGIALDVADGLVTVDSR